MALGQCLLENGSDELSFRKRIPFSRFKRSTVIRGGEFALELEVLSRNHGMVAQVVAKREVPEFQLRPDSAEMDVVRTRRGGWLLKERVDQIELAERDMGVANVSEPLEVDGQWLKCRDGNLNVNDGLCGQAGH